jgi:uncharacterized protein with von Willebrand factor type A (vWA) domain
VTLSGPKGLVDRQVGFVEALRSAGLPVSLAEALDAARGVAAIDLLDREQLRAAYAAACVKRPAHRAAFDALFDLWYPPAVGDPTPAGKSDRAEEPGTDADADPAAARDAMRDALRNILLDGDDEALRRFARQAVGRLGQASGGPGRQSWFSYRVLRSLSPETLMASLLEAMRDGVQRGGLDEKVARQTIAERIRKFTEYVEAEVRRRVAEERGLETITRTAIDPLTEQVEFLRASRDDLVALRREVYPLARRLATRLTSRRRLGTTGRLDFRRTVRSSLSTGGVPLVTHHRPAKPHRPELTVLCDVSGSVASFAHFTLLLAYAMREQFAAVRAFAFVDTCDEVTSYFAPGGDVGDAMSRIARQADVVWFDGHSDYGHAFEVFAERWPDAVTPRTSLLVLGDARTNYRSPALPTVRALVRQARHAYWLNPEPSRYWGSGDSAAAAYGGVIDMRECRNVAQLSEFVRDLLPG